MALSELRRTAEDIVIGNLVAPIYAGCTRDQASPLWRPFNVSFLSQQTIGVVGY